MTGPQWRGPNRDGVSSETGWAAQWPDSGPKVLWKADVGKGCSSLAVANGLVYTMGNITEGETERDVVWCLNADTGAVVWKVAYPQPLDPGGFPGGPCVTPCVHGKRVYTVRRTGRASCFDARTGEIIWKTEPNDQFDKPYQDDFHYGGLGSSPIVDGDLLVTGTRALNKDMATIYSSQPLRSGADRIPPAHCSASTTAVRRLSGRIPNSCPASRSG